MRVVRTFTVTGLLLVLSTDAHTSRTTDLTNQTCPKALQSGGSFLKLEGSDARYLSDRSELEKAGRVLARAFFSDGQMDYMFPDRETQLRKLDWLLPRVVRTSAFKQGVIANKEGPIKGVALWHHTDHVPGTLEELRVGLLLAPIQLSLGSLSRLKRLQAYLDEIKKRHCANGCYYLYFLGTDPEHQGQGIAGKLIQPAIDASERDQIPLYLETQKAENVAFYERFGFHVIHEGKEAPQAPTSFVMIRNPQ